MAHGPYPSEHRRFLPPELQRALAEQDPELPPAGEAAADGVTEPEDVAPSRLRRFLHARAWKYLVGWASFLALLVLFGMMCSPVYWRF